MSVREDVKEMKQEIKEIQEESFAMQILKDYKKINKRMFITLITVLIMWFATIGAFVYYINTTGYEETIEIADTGEGGNACVGDSCNNGVINGNSN
ncbi:MAG: hypothetical protein J6C46_08490 [Clostridia bacterium]|nr:hypothetical protein [Clostridia bacterium]